AAVRGEEAVGADGERGAGDGARGAGGDEGPVLGAEDPVAGAAVGGGGAVPDDGGAAGGTGEGPARDAEEVGDRGGRCSDASRCRSRRLADARRSTGGLRR